SGGGGRLMRAMSDDEATSSADDATLAPLAASGFTPSAFVSNTHSVCPASSSRFAIGPPMRPTPTNPNTCSLICPRYSAQLPSYLATQLPLYERIRHRRRGGNPHAFHLQVFLDHVLTALAPDAGALVSAKRREIAHGAIRGDPKRTRLESVGHRQRPAHVLRPDASGQTIHHVIPDRDRFFFILERNHREDGTEDFLLRDSHTVVDVLEDRRLDETA